MGNVNRVVSLFVLLLSLLTSISICENKALSAKVTNSAFINNIVSRFHEGIKLYKKYQEAEKLSIEKASTEDEYWKIRQKTDDYNEKILFLAYFECVKILSEKQKNNKPNKYQKVLIEEFLKILLVFEGSADEEWSRGSGEAYFRNPYLIEYGIRKFSVKKQKMLVERINRSFEYYSDGFEYFAPGEDKKQLESIRKRLEEFTDLIRMKQ
ncbi:MAG: hypothetical protein A2252_04930 [Elusimicrobia bacterium RIFOXYA2_FULL_39_19]|nr:MAG: hypothetical protein A2252_04930 [Elusimicrobia bacterium RIFOXYA2_FULL_39_19]